jgi:cyclic pyranopterin phosphate synthase
MLHVLKMRQSRMSRLTHVDDKGKARMVDVSGKNVTLREAVASGAIFMKPETFRMVVNAEIAKGDVLGVAKIAGIMAAKKTSELIPLCHPLDITHVDIQFHLREKQNSITIEAAVKTLHRTGAEMEAMVAVTAAALTIYDMCKAVDRAMVISDIKLLKKSGGKSGTYRLKRA